MIALNSSTSSIDDICTLALDSDFNTLISNLCPNFKNNDITEEVTPNSNDKAYMDPLV